MNTKSDSDLYSQLHDSSRKIYVDTQKIITELLGLSNSLKERDWRIDELESEVHYLHFLLEKHGCDTTTLREVWNRPAMEPRFRALGVSG
jgi:hypothetical protein